MRAAVLFVLCATATVAVANPADDGVKATAALAKIAAGPEATRKAALAELAELAPTSIPAIGSWLARTRTTGVADRRAVLTEIKAAIPDKSGKFSTPPRQSGKERQADDDIDWLAALRELPAGPAVGEVIADVAAIRALSATKDIGAAQVLFGVAFGEATMIYRDEVGRYIRKMEPYSIPALTRESQGKGADRRRYATFQLERLDRQDALKALAASQGNEALQVAVLEAFRAVKLREAVHATWTRVNDDSPRVRAAARATWMDYITGPPPPPAPRKKLQLPGGKLTKKPKPLWLTYRELADNELRKAANELLHEDFPLDDEEGIDDRESNAKPVVVDLPAVTKRLFAYYDGERTKQESGQWVAAKAKADAGDLAGAVAMLDRLISANPARAEHAEIATLYAAWGKQLEAKQQWAEAAVAYAKAHGLDAKAAAATDRLAAHHFAQGKALERAGKDGGPDYRRAIALRPDYAPAEAAAARTTPNQRPTWMLLAAGAAVALALLLFAGAVLRRRAEAR